MRSIALLLFVVSYVHGDRFAIVGFGDSWKNIINETCPINCYDIDTRKDFNCTGGYNYSGLNVTKMYNDAWLFTFRPVFLGNAHRFCVNCAARVISCYFLFSKSTTTCTDSICNFEFPNKLKELFIGVISAASDTLISNVTVVTANISGVSWPSTAADPKLIIFEYNKATRIVHYETSIDVSVNNRSQVFAQKINKNATEATTKAETPASTDRQMPTEAIIFIIVFITAVAGILFSLGCCGIEKFSKRQKLRGQPLLNPAASTHAGSDRESADESLTSGSSAEPDQSEDIRPSDPASDGNCVLVMVASTGESNANGVTHLRSGVLLEPTARTVERASSEIAKDDEASAEQLIAGKSNDTDYPFTAGRNCGNFTHSQDDLSERITVEGLSSVKSEYINKDGDNKMAAGSATRVLVMDVRGTGNNITLSNPCDARSQSRENKNGDLKQASLQTMITNSASIDNETKSQDIVSDPVNITTNSDDSAILELNLVADETRQFGGPTKYADEIPYKERTRRAAYYLKEPAIKQGTADPVSHRIEEHYERRNFNRCPNNFSTLDSHTENAVLLDDAGSNDVRIPDEVPKSAAAVSSLASIHDITSTHRPENTQCLMSDEMKFKEPISSKCDEMDSSRDDSAELTQLHNVMSSVVSDESDKIGQRIKNRTISSVADQLSFRHASLESDGSQSQAYKPIDTLVALDDAYKLTVPIGTSISIVEGILEDAQELAYSLQPPLRENDNIEDMLQTDLIKACKHILSIARAFSALRLAICDAQGGEFEKISITIARGQCRCIKVNYYQLIECLHPTHVSIVSSTDNRLKIALNAALQEIDHIGMNVTKISEILFSLITKPHCLHAAKDTLSCM